MRRTVGVGLIVFGVTTTVIGGLLGAGVGFLLATPAEQGSRACS